MMKRYAVITKVEVYSGDDHVGTIYEEDSIGYKAKLADTFMCPNDIAFVGKVLEFVDENGDLDIEEEM